MNRCNLYPCFTDEETGTVIQSNCLEVTIKFLSRTLFESLTLLPVVITFLSIHPLISSSLCPFSCTFFPSRFIHSSTQPYSLPLYYSPFLYLPTPSISIANESFIKTSIHQPFSLPFLLLTTMYPPTHHPANHPSTINTFPSLHLFLSFIPASPSFTSKLSCPFIHLYIIPPFLSSTPFFQLFITSIRVISCWAGINSSIHPSTHPPFPSHAINLSSHEDTHS